jgi:hypothetical protein
MSRQPLILFVILTLILLSGCSTMDSMRSFLDSRLRARPAEGTGFVPMEELAKDPRLPFDKAWIQQGVDWQRYRTIYIAPVNTDYLRQANWWQEGIRAGQMEQDVQNLASFMRTQFIRAFQDDPRRRFRVVMAPEKGSLTLATALTELVPNKVALNAMRSAAPFVAPIGAGLAVSAFERGTGAQSTVAFEAKVKDSDSGRIVAMFADRNYAIVRPIDLRGFTWYGNAQEIIRQWAGQFVQIANKRPGEIIRPASTFSLLPW